MTKVTIHLHSVHYQQSGLGLQEYLMLLLYEQKANWKVPELAKFLSLSQRTVTRSRAFLLQMGYLVKSDQYRPTHPSFKVSDVLYPEKNRIFMQAS